MKNKKKKMKKLTKFLIVFDSIAVICLFLMYGPISYFRNLWITTSMTTMTHKYLARTFFNNDTIESIVSNNYIKDNGSTTDISAIQIGNIQKPTSYESIYEEQILDREEGTLYKIIEVSGSNYKGYMAVIYDPSRISLATAKYFGRGGQTIDKIISNNNAILGINANGFSNGTVDGKPGSIPCGNVIKDGKLIWEGSRTGNFIGFSENSVLMLKTSTAQEAIDAGMKDAVEFGPFLIVNGVPAEEAGTDTVLVDLIPVPFGDPASLDALVYEYDPSKATD